MKMENSFQMVIGDNPLEWTWYAAQTRIKLSQQRNALDDFVVESGARATANTGRNCDDGVSFKSCCRGVYSDDRIERRLVVLGEMSVVGVE